MWDKIVQTISLPPLTQIHVPEPERLLQLPREAEVARMGLGDAAALRAGSTARRGLDRTARRPHGRSARRRVGVARLLARAVHVIEEEPGEARRRRGMEVRG